MSEKKIIQSKIFLENESNAWLNRSEKINPSKQFKVPNERLILANWCSSRKNRIENILEIGVGNGVSLAFLSKALDANANGIDPSSQAIENWEKIRTNVDGGDKTNLQLGISSDLPFPQDKFDLVIFGSCLCWIERQCLFRSISEADRVLKDGGLLAIIDFDPISPYANPYIHRDSLNTYKTNYSDIFLASKHYSLMYKHSFSHSSINFDEKIDERMALSLLFKQEDEVYFQHWKKE